MDIFFCKNQIEIKDNAATITSAECAKHCISRREVFEDGGKLFAGLVTSCYEVQTQRKLEFKI
jgi:hypothetical protein